MLCLVNVCEGRDRRGVKIEYEVAAIVTHLGMSEHHAGLSGVKDFTDGGFGIAFASDLEALELNRRDRSIDQKLDRGEGISLVGANE